MSELRFEGLSVRFGRGVRALTAVDRVDLTVPDGAIVGLVGESGSGKSTLARAAVGLSPISAGRILLDGEPLRRRSHGRRRVQMIFQDPASALDPRMTVGESIAEVLPRQTPASRRTEVSRLLELVQLDASRANVYPAQLSGGQRQRIAMARALASRPEVIIADEITSALDVSIQGTVINVLRELQRELGLSVLFISHNLPLVRYMSDSIAVMYLGRIVEQGPTHSVLLEAQHPYTRTLLAAVPDGASGPATGIDTLELANPQAPPSGCGYHRQCPIGPIALPDREVCRTDEPSNNHLHRAACHFAASAETLTLSTPRSTT